MNRKTEKLNTVAENVILGSVLGIVVGYILKLIYQRIGGTELVWISFFILGPTIGYLSGKERVRFEKLKNEKLNLKKNLEKIQDALNASTKKYRLLVERANDAIFLTSESGKFLLFNQATCLLSGYSKAELKNMSLSKLEFEKDGENKLQKAWLDNGVCRYEERWENKNGSVVFVDVSAKWIQFSNYRLILYIARDIQRKRESNIENTAQNIKHYQLDKLGKITQVHRGYNKHVLGLLSNTINKINDLEKKQPELLSHFSDLLSELEQIQKRLEMVSLKNSRDLNTLPIEWNINDIIMQELYCLELLTDSDEFVARTSLDSKEPMVFGKGGDFSIILGIIFQSVLDSTNGLNKKEMSISTRSMDDSVAVEIRTNGPILFEESLVKIMNPFVQLNNLMTTEQVEKEFSVCQAFVELLGMKISVEHSENDQSVIKILIPTKETETNRNKKVSMKHSRKSVMY